MNADVMSKTLHQTVWGYAHTEHRHIVQVHTFDGIDRTWQSSGAGESRIDHHEQATIQMDDLFGKMRGADLPMQWLLDVTIVVETYDRKKREATTTNWAVVLVPDTATLVTGEGVTAYTNRNGLGVHVVHIGGGTTRFPKHLALDLQEN